MAPREVRADQHGTLTAYAAYGCRCDDCRRANREYRREYDARNREAVRERDRKYKERNREAVRESWREYAARNREALAERTREYYASNRDAVLERDREYRARNRGYLLTKKRTYSARLQSDSLRASTVPALTRWMPHEDALLDRIPSDIAAASALGRSLASVNGRRNRLRVTSQRRDQS